MCHTLQSQAQIGERFAYSDATKDSKVFMNADRAPGYSSPEFKNRDYFLGLL
jgi:hypothetical protein